MLKNFLRNFVLSVAILLFLSITVNAGDDCVSLNTYNNSCDRFIFPYNEFDLTYDNSEIVKNYSVEIYNVENPNNKISTEKLGGYKVQNTDPFTKPGLYKIDVTSTLRNGEKITKSKEFIFDNSLPKPPVVSSSSDSLEYEGKAKGADYVKVEYGGDTQQVDTGENGNFSVTLNTETLDNGYNKIKFYSHKGNLISTPLGKIAYNGDTPDETESDVSEINLVDLSEHNRYSVKVSGNSYKSSKRNFYVEGSIDSGTKGVPVYVHGQKILTDSEGDFAAYIILNEGEDEYKVESNGVTETFSVDYTPSNFEYYDIEMEKVTSDNTQISMNTSSNSLLNVYINGKLQNSLWTGNGEFSFEVNNLEEGRNLIEFYGPRGEILRRTIYKDIESPNVSVESEEFAWNNDFVFEAKDDTGTPVENMDVNINGEDISSNSIKSLEDYYIINIKELSEGTYPYSITVRDRAGRETQKDGQIEVNKDFTLIDDITFNSGGYNVGDKLFVQSGENEIEFDPSRYIALKKVYVDGIEQNDYTISKEGIVTMNLNFSREEGEMNLTFINNEHEEFTRTFTYYTDKEKPEVVLNHVSSPDTYSNQMVRISGKVKDSNFNWSSLSFNGQNNVLRFGSKFEAFVPVSGGVSNLQIYGKDIAGNSVSPSVKGSLLYSDGTETTIGHVENASVYNVEGSLTDLSMPERVTQFLGSYDGLDVKNVHISNNFNLATPDREGVRSINMKGRESSDREFNQDKIYTVDKTNPNIYFKSENNGELKVIVDGTHSSIDEINISVEEGAYGDCQNYERVSVNDACKVLSVDPGNTVEVEAKDMAGNTATKSLEYSGTMNEIDMKFPEDGEIYFSGNEKVVSGERETIVLQGRMKMPSVVASVSLDGSECVYDSSSFACETTLEKGENILPVTVATIEGEEYTENYTVTRGESSLEISMDDVISSNDYIYEVGDDYYMSQHNIELSGNITESTDFADSSSLSVIVDGEEKLLGEITQEDYSVEVNLSEHTEGKEEEEMNIKLKATSPDEEESFTEEISVIYDRVMETIVDVVVR